MIKLIVAVDEKFGIAKNGIIPWNNKEDLKFFKRITSEGHNAVVMGRKTMETLLNNKLPGRDNYIISSKNLPNTININDIKSLESKYDIVWIIGGASIYKQTMEKCIPSVLYISFIPGNYNCDTFLEMNDKYIQYNEMRFNTFLLKLYKCKK